MAKGAARSLYKNIIQVPAFKIPVGAKQNKFNRTLESQFEGSVVGGCPSRQRPAHIQPAPLHSVGRHVQGRLSPVAGNRVEKGSASGFYTDASVAGEELNSEVASYCSHLSRAPAGSSGL